MLITGYECQSTWNRFEADFLGNESVTTPPNMGFYLDCTCLCNHSNQLLKQGNAFLRSSHIIFKNKHMLP